MKFSDWKLGISTSFYKKYDDETLSEYKNAGIECLELSFGYKYFYDEIDLTRKHQAVKELADKNGLELWSIHLPFSRDLDISLADEEKRSFAMNTHLELIEAASKAGVSVAVVHPSSEPIEDNDRPARLIQSRESLKILSEKANSVGMRLAVENLPRTCLVNHSDEAEYMLDAIPELNVVFDTNHLLKQDNVEFINKIGSRIISLHVSDYDFIDERHQLPLEGKNDWQGIIRALENNGYNGPWMYEASSREIHKAIDIRNNRDKLAKML